MVASARERGATTRQVLLEYITGGHRIVVGTPEQVADDLTLLSSGEAAQARLLAGRLATALGRPAEADNPLTEAARNRHRRVTALARSQGWLAEALEKRPLAP